jgi:nucleotide-binding universal stress UspA family protein
VRVPFRSIVCPTDFSPVGNAALAVARRLAAPGGVLHLAHVRLPAFVLSPMDASPAFVLPAGNPDEEAEADRRAAARLRALPARKTGVSVRVHVLSGADAATELLRLAREVSADAVVIGTHGRGGIGRALLGSVASAVSRRSPAPVVLVRPARAGRARGRS